MNKLETIDNFLKSRNDLFVHALSDRFYTHQHDSCVNHDIAYMIAPKNGLFDTVPRLQNFMVHLIPKGIKPSYKKDFCQDDVDSWIRGGYLYFDEIIGQEKVLKTLTSNDPYLAKHGFKDGQKIVEDTYNIRRRISLYPFPNKKYLTDMLNEGLYIMTGPMSFHPSKLAKYSI